MSDKTPIIYIKGPACPDTHDKIAQEELQMRRDLAGFRQGEYRPVTIGNSKNGFDLAAVTETLRDNPDCNILVIDAHGNIEDAGKHYMQAQPYGDDKEVGRLSAKALFTEIAEQRAGKPINIFMLSCGSGASCVEAVSMLPPGSTLINMVQDNGLYSYCLQPEGYSYRDENNTNAAERLFLGILGHGMNGLKNYPQITISQPECGIENIWSLWDVARMETLADDIDDFDSVVKELDGRLDTLFSKELIDQSLATMRLGLKFYGTPDLTADDTPVTLPVSPDMDGFYRNIVKHKLLGPMCAIAYIINREKIGAFQTWPAEKYAPRPERPAPSGLFSSLLASSANP